VEGSRASRKGVREKLRDIGVKEPYGGMRITIEGNEKSCVRRVRDK
jgi:hypothetical protein